MKNRISFRWRITFMTMAMIAAACILMNFLVVDSGSYYIDSIGETLNKYSTNVSETDGVIVADMTPEQFADFFKDFDSKLGSSKDNFTKNVWMITLSAIIICGFAAYFICGFFMKPLKEFSAQAQHVQAEGLSDMRLNEDTVKEFRELSVSINQMLSRLASSFEAQNQFAANAAHELRTPLALMQTKLDLCDESSLSAGEISSTIHLLREQTERLSAMIRTLLDMSELSEIPRDEHIELAPLIEEVFTDLSPLAEKSDISLVYSGENAVITGSDILIYRMLFNLVENAIKYNYEGGEVALCVDLVSDSVLISVKDTGRGIPKDAADSIFQPFFRVDKSRSRALGGAGLGLALVYEIAALHGGSVTLSASDKSGSAFTVRLPL